MANNEEKKDPKLADTIRKILTSGSPSEISKELLSTVVGQALKAKDDVALKVTNEMIGLVRKIDFVREFSKFAENHKFRITAEVEVFKKENDESKTENKMEIKSGVSVDVKSGSQAGSKR